MSLTSDVLRLSVIIPVYNEAESIPLLVEKLAEALTPLGIRWEVVFINDGSKDETEEVLDEICKEGSFFRAVHFRRNYGQTAAMQAGFQHARGEIIVAMDGDLQNDPADIKTLLDEMEKGFDVVSGWRSDRKDAKFRRNFLSRVANRLISIVSGVKLHDYGCSLKAYRKEVIKEVRLYGEMHRFIPIYASWIGSRVGEVQVNHFARQHGKSNYGMERIFKVLLDLIVVKFLHKYSQKPMYVFGGFGLLSFGIGTFAFLWALYLRLTGYAVFTATPLPLVTIFCALSGVISILMGLLAELITRTYFESQNKQTYGVRALKNFPAEGTLEQDG